MPELPEVETVRLGLSRLVLNKMIKTVSHDYPKGFPNSEQDVRLRAVGAQIVGVRRRAKVLMIDLSSNYSLIVHLKMTGQLVYRDDRQRFGAGHPNDSLVGQLPDKTTRVVIEFTDGSHLFFNDQRKFGWMRLMPTAEVETIDFMQKVGPEPLDGSLTPDIFVRRMRRRNGTMVKAALLDQTVIAGIGNIYADESLWMAKIHPAQRVRDVGDPRLIKLLAAARTVLKMAIDKGGSTDRNYVNAEGGRGSYIDYANAFRREGKPCPRCGEIIIKMRVAGRGTHICPREQVLGEVQ